MTCTFSADQITALSAPLDRAKVRQREQGRSQVSYLEGWPGITFAHTIDRPEASCRHAKGQKSAYATGSAAGLRPANRQTDR